MSSNPLRQQSDPLAPTPENLAWAHDRIGTLTERCEALAAERDRYAATLRDIAQYAFTLGPDASYLTIYDMALRDLDA